jgi:hypothetical protein
VTCSGSSNRRRLVFCWLGSAGGLTRRCVLQLLAACAPNAACYTSWPRVQCKAACYNCWPRVHLMQRATLLGRGCNAIQRSGLHFLAAGAMHQCSAAGYTSWPRVQCNTACSVLHFLAVGAMHPRRSGLHSLGRGCNAIQRSGLHSLGRVVCCLPHSFSCSSNVLTCSSISVWSSELTS